MEIGNQPIDNVARVGRQDDKACTGTQHIRVMRLEVVEDGC